MSVPFPPGYGFPCSGPVIDLAIIPLRLGSHTEIQKHSISNSSTCYALRVIDVEDSKYSSLQNQNTAIIKY